MHPQPLPQLTPYKPYTLRKSLTHPQPTLLFSSNLLLALNIPITITAALPSYTSSTSYSNPPTALLSYSNLFLPYPSATHTSPDISQ